MELNFAMEAKAVIVLRHSNDFPLPEAITELHLAMEMAVGVGAGVCGLLRHVDHLFFEIWRCWRYRPQKLNEDKLGMDKYNTP